MSETAKTSVLAIVSLVLGVISFFGLWLITGIPAVICGHIAASKIKKSEGSLKGKGMALAGLIIGYLSIVISILLFVVLVLFAEEVHTEMQKEIQNMEAMEQPAQPSMD